MLQVSVDRRMVQGIILALTGFSATGQAQITEFNGVEVPGIVVAHIAASNDYKYNSPSIAILPDGSYVISNDVTGNNAPSPSPTYIHRSTDQGQTWTQISSVSNLIWANLYVYNNDLYLMGRNGSGFVVRKSTDNGYTWTNPTSSTTGLIANVPGSTYHTAPVNVVEYNGRLWRSIETRASGVDGSSAGVMSIPIGADLLNASNWTFSNRILNQESWLPGNDFDDWIEGNVVVDREGDLVNIIRVNVPRGDDEVAAIIRVNNPGTVTFDPSSDIIDFNGGAKKFDIQYDPATDRYWSFANIITPYNEDITVLPSSHRDIVALVQSRDMRNWDVEKIVVQDLSDMDNIGFQYWDWEFDGDDMIAASRTAYPDGLGGAIRFHDANFITFHRVEDYATTRPTQALVADTDNNRVMRYELTGTDLWMPVAKFELGNTFAGAALTKPTGLTKDSAGIVYISEQADGGRVLAFDSSGNFLDVIATGGIDFTGRPEALTVGPDGNLYMSVAFGANSDKVYKIDLETGNVTLFIDTTFPGGTLSDPRAIAFGDDGHLYVADRNNDAVRRFDGATGAYLGDLFNTESPEGLTWDELNNRLIASGRNILDTDLFEAQVTGSSSIIYDPADIGRALGIVVIDGETYWTDWDNGRVYRLKDTDVKSTSVSGLNRPGHIIQADPMPVGERSWTKTSVGYWSDWDNWTYWSRPDTSDEVAFFGSAIGNAVTVVVDNDYTVKGLRFRNTNRYTLGGTGSITLQAYSGRALIDTQLGDHEITVPLTLQSDADAATHSSAVLRFKNTLDLNGHEFVVTGTGRIWVHNSFSMNGGTLVLDGLAPFSFADTSSATLDGYLEFRPAPGTDLSLGAAFDLFNGIAYVLDPFDDIILPELLPWLAWDTTSLMVNGIITVVEGLTGDLDGDGFVGIGDLNIVLGNWNANTPPADPRADPSGDGFVGIQDLNIILGNWNAGTPPIEINANIPEPGSLILLITGLIAGYRRVV
ncbi:MAG: hypothetical protein R3C45_08390 [Phycisphaerales bacterium]